ncbi:PREDICTED: putative GPI-anchored protein PB15E9.01c [Dinoponera quadriceps]|uniref:GPI-anchored protein PB15E9.01c n=1 Tax=Dinoponera quadriceps TaxID=609295 RepID=A0A6P3YDH2_DINQU|nr:PREDICTED: putative GPI-anchored protein PB15E9.01c [Dinoponera quadriceps]
MRTVEIKAKIRNYEYMLAKIWKLGEYKYPINTIDTFYEATNGKLMLRKFEEFEYASLISYERSEEEGLQVCNSYGSLLCHRLPLLQNILSVTNGIIGSLKKHRQAHYTKEAVIHIDNVLNLGNFVEIKVTEKDNINTEAAKKLVNDLMQELSIASEDLVTKSYIDLMLEKGIIVPHDSQIPGPSTSSSLIESSGLSETSGTPSEIAGTSSETAGTSSETSEIIIEKLKSKILIQPGMSSETSETVLQSETSSETSVLSKETKEALKSNILTRLLAQKTPSETPGTSGMPVQSSETFKKPEVTSKLFKKRKTSETETSGTSGTS